VVKEIEDNSLDSIYVTPRSTNIQRIYYDDVVEGMRSAATVGTCRSLLGILPGIEACGKTGTAQNRGKDHSVFMGFAPMNNPEIAIAVYVENGGFGAEFAVPIGGLLLEKYLTGKLSPWSQKRARDFQKRRIAYGSHNR
jgi:penicillin-binding protein 2